jgi:hypothetical protein
MEAKKMPNPFGERQTAEDLPELSKFLDSTRFADYSVDLRMQRIKNKATRFS